MSDLISRQAAIEEWKEDFKGFVNSLDMPRDDYRGIMEYIDELPYADRPQGEWIIHKINGIPHTAECSCCHNHYDYEDLRRIGGIKEIIALPYCPNCGCRMKGADDEVD